MQGAEENGLIATLRGEEELEKASRPGQSESDSEALRKSRGLSALFQQQTEEPSNNNKRPFDPIKQLAAAIGGERVVKVRPTAIDAEIEQGYHVSASLNFLQIFVDKAGGE